MKRLMQGFLIAGACVAIMGLANPLNNMKTYQITCAASPTALAGTNGRTDALLVWNNTATAAYIGGSDVDDSTKGMPICTSTSTCIASNLSLDSNASSAFCYSTGGAVVVTVLRGR